jgi:cobalamin biosynthesis Mg chelatase CobN
VIDPIEQEEPTKFRTVVKVDDLAIDEQTGEILEYPDGWTGDLIDYLAQREEYASQQSKEWKRSQDMLRFAIGKMLRERDIEAYTTRYGQSIKLRQTTRRSATFDRLQSLMNRKRLPATLCRSIAQQLAATFDVDGLKRLAANLEANGSTVHAQIIREELIEEKVTRYIQVDPAKAEAPTMIRTQVPTSIDAMDES